MEYRLTSHAEKTIAERGIDKCWIELILSHPARVEIDRHDSALRHALGRIPEHGDRVLRVIYNAEVSPWVVVTAFFDRKAGRTM